MYHIGVVEKLIRHSDKGIYAAENTTQALVKMWDEGIITVLVHPMLNGQIKEKDYVLVRFAPQASEETIVKILPKKTGEYLKDYYKKFIDAKKKKEPQPQKLRLEVPKVIDNPESLPLSGMVR